MVYRVNISAEANEALREYNWRTACRGMVERPRNADGSITIELDDDTYAALLDHRIAGEPISDTIMRLTGDRARVQ